MPHNTNDVSSTHASPKTEPLAIVGMACRFSGGVTSPEKLWDFVSKGRSGWSKIPEERFNQQSFYHPKSDMAAASNIGGGYFLEEDVGRFDPSFFNFTSEVAAAMDPQIRMLLELTFESLESAGLPLHEVAGSNTSVYAGSFTKDYHDRMITDPQRVPPAFIAANYTAMIANRISHFFDFKGPSTAVDTGCSSSLMGLHLACQSLRSRESDCAIVGGSCINLNPDIFVALSTLGSCGPDGISYAFDHRVQGYGRGEGVAILVVKRLEDAIKNRDPIRAVIRETAANQDGKTPTITSPDLDAQRNLIRACYERAGIPFHETALVEAHGTGTKAGDPIEATAIGAAISKGRPENQPVYLGSVKTNLGHTEAASGLAAIIKTAKSLEVGQIPPSINFEKPNPDIDFEGLRLKVPQKLISWPTTGIRRASVNNFGYGGTNTHVILEEGGQYSRKTNGVNGIHGALARKLFVLSGRDEAATSRLAANMNEYLQRTTDLHWNDLAFTLGQRRSKFNWSVAVSAESVGELMNTLSDKSLKPVQIQGRVPRLGFVFNGQGAQWYAMGRELMAAYPVFLSTLETCDATIKQLGAAWSIIEELKRDQENSRVNEVRYSMPLTCSIQLALVQLLSHWGVKPAAVTGHSTGEVAAAFAAGAISLEEAIVVTYFRGKINAEAVERKTSGGAMMAVGLGPDEVKPYLQDLKRGQVHIACFNSPSSVTLSGDVEPINELERRFGSEGIFARKLKVQAAFHSHHMLPLQKEYRAALTKYMRKEERTFTQGVKFSSPVSGDVLYDANVLGPEHWITNMIQPVQFTSSFRNMVITEMDEAPRQDVDIVVEIGPHSALAGPVRQCLSEPSLKSLGIMYASCLEREKDAVQTAQSLGVVLLQKGYALNMTHVNFPTGDSSCQPIFDLPSYPWNHSTSYWNEPRTSRDHRFRKHPTHDLLGIRLPGTSDLSPVWKLNLKAENVPWVRDHIVQSDIVYPAAGYICMAIEAIRQLNEQDNKVISGYKLRDIDILKALVIPESGHGVDVQLFLEPVRENSLVQEWRQFHIYSAASAEEPWVENARGLIAVESSELKGLALNSSLALDVSTSNYTRTMNPKTLFESLHKVGVAHGPLFQNLDSIRIASGTSATKMTVSDMAPTMPYGYQQPHVIHPITLDSIFQAFYPVLSPESRKAVGASVPRSIKTLYISSRIKCEPGSTLEAHSHLIRHDLQGFNAAAVILQLGNRAETPVVEIEDMHFQSLGRTTDEATPRRQDLCVVNEWTRNFSLNDLTPFEESLKMDAGDDEAEIGRDLVRVTYNLVHEALSQLTATDIENLDWHHKRFYDWMLVLDEQGATNQLAPKSERWSKTSEGVKHMLMDKAEKASVNGELAIRIGKNLLPILRKEVAPLELMLEGQLLYKYYQQLLHFTRCATQAAKVVRAIAEENPEIRILEIGAGTGGATLPVLDALSADGCHRFKHYDFTDISAGFFQSARELLEPWGDKITFSALDIEKDLEQQGFELGSYDVIVAAQVLHATKNMTNTMSNVRKLLKDGGKLVLVETTRDSPDVQLVFGSVPGWWLSEEPDRKLSPNMSLDTWDKHLRETGFTGNELSVWDCEDQEHQAMSCIMSTAKSDQKPEFERIVAIVYADEPPPSDWTLSLMENIVRETGTTPVLADLATYDATGKICIFLSGLQGTIQRYSEESFSSIKRLVTGSKGILWVSSGSAVDCEIPENAMHLGLLRTARLEDQSKRYVSLDLDPSRNSWSLESTDAIIRVFHATMHNNVGVVDMEYAERGTVLLNPRLRPDSVELEDLYEGLEEKKPEMQPFVQPGRELRMHVDVPGLLDSIVFKDNENAQLPLEDGWVEIEPMAFGLNFRDVMTAMGMLKELNQEMGVECAGIVTGVGNGVSSVKVGERVCALTVHGHFANRVRVPWTSAVRIPESMSFETAASMVIVFVTAYYSLFWAGHGEEGDTVLIHSAAGGVGQACIILAQWRGLEIYATVGSQEKRDFLTNTYGIPPERMFSSRDPSFAKDVLKATKNRGVDIIVNSLAGKLLDASWNLLAPHGRFVEIGKRDLHHNKSLEMEPFRKAVSFMHVDVVQLTDNRPAIVQRILQQIVRLLDQNIIRSIAPVKAFSLAEVGRAFRTMQAGEHIGKLVLVPSANCMVKASRPRGMARLHPDATYMVVGGLTGIGASVAKLLVDRNAKHLVLVSRNATSRPGTAAMTTELSATGCNVVAKDCDVGNMDSLKSLVDDCRKAGMPAIKGIIHGGMVLQDSILERMTWAQWQSALNPKLLGTRNIDELFGDQLDFYIMLSSGVGVMGNPSQANYGAGGSYQDAVARHRASKGQAAVAIDLGVVQSVGFVAETASVEERLSKAGHRPLSEAEVMGLVEYGIKKPCRSPRTSHVASGFVQATTADPRFALLKNAAEQTSAGAAGGRAAGSGKEIRLSEQIAQAKTADEATAAVQQAVVTKISDMFVIQESEINPCLPLSEYGVDSLVAVELRNWLVPNARIEMSIFDLLGSPSLAELAKSVVKRSKVLFTTI
ncbi:putative polyketide synthase [Xylaria bambusicola]|uniref:putative polyketide synthase n=1 Tax=Xylaria bambusicola TaxID=326684 RepID=UPI0020072AD4|nr:putative polyketide synthase [Xylaria bambusicola]KAI0506887.1 putative polyketide synthase [Xylaria bambusicola]